MKVTDLKMDGLGHEEKPIRVVELPQRRLGQAVHEALVNLGEEVRPDPDAQGRGGAFPVSGQHPDLCQHRITSGTAEEPNNKIMAIKRRACG